MDEKDHLGEKLRLKELADEDRYFAARDRETLQHVKERQAAAQEDRIRQQSHGRCPQCGEPLHQRTIHNVTTLECLPCQGIWFNKEHLAALSHPHGNAWVETFLRGLGWWRSFPRQ